MNIKYDQHFLIDENIIIKTIEKSNINKDDTIFEIGPGKGVLTKEILKQNPKQLISIEKDETLKPYLEEIQNSNNNKTNFKLIFSNGLDEIKNYKFDKLIANIPYCITEPLFTKLIESKIKIVIILFGKTFYDTITTRVSKWNYFLNAFYNIELIKEVLGDKFNPPTKTKSVLVKFEIKEKLSERDKLILELFFLRNSKTRNAILKSFQNIFNLTKKESIKKYKKLKINLLTEEKTINNLSNQEFHLLIKQIDDKTF